MNKFIIEDEILLKIRTALEQIKAEIIPSVIYFQNINNTV